MNILVSKEKKDIKNFSPDISIMRILATIAVITIHTSTIIIDHAENYDLSVTQYTFF